MSEQSIIRVRPPSAATIREQVGRFVELWLDAMFLKREGYAYERERKNPFGNGLVYIAIIGVLVAITGMFGAGLRFATEPSLDAVKNTVLVHLQAMPFYSAFDSASATAFDQGYDQWWDQSGAGALGYPADASGIAALALSLLTTPLGLIIGWLIYGALVHLIARGWNPETSFGEMLAPLALATSPHLLNILTLLPSANVSGLAVALWTLLCNVVAIRVAYQTTTRRAVWGALFPLLLLIVFLFVLVIFGIVIGASARRGG